MGTGVSSPRIVGRSQELDALTDALARATAGEPALVVVAGVAGVGKSRLVAEFAARARALGARVLVGDCLELLGGGLPFGPLAAILRDMARTTRPDRIAEILGPAREELARLVPELGLAPDASSASGQNRIETIDVDTSRAEVRLFEHLLGVIGRLGDEAPTVVMLEDVHWIDPATRDLISFLARSLRTERVLFVLTSRTEHLPRTHPHAAWLAELSRSPRTRIMELEPFSPDETAAQLLAILDTRPEPELVSQVHLRSEGNPLFNEELLTAIRSGSSSLPAILSDALGAKIRALPARSVEVLQVAAIASRSFDERLVAAVLGGVEEDFLEPVRDAVVGQVLIAGPTSYHFRHGLFAEAIVADLTPGERRNLHARLAAALEARPDLAAGGPAGVAGEAADHWRAADRPADAYRCAVEAGLLAAAMYAHGVALERWEQALAIADRVPPARRAEFLGSAGLDESELLIRVARVAALSQEHDRAVTLAGQALASIDSNGGSARSAVLRSEYARILWAAGRFEPAHEMLRQAADLVQATGTVADRARVLSRYANMFWWRGRFDEEIATAREAVEAARQSGLRAVEVEALEALGYGLWFTGSIREAIQRLSEARQAAIDSGSVEEQLFASDSLAECLVDADHFEEAVAVARLAEDEARRHGIDRPYGAMFRGNAGLALFCLGRWAEAEALTDHGMDVGHGRVWGLSIRARLLAAMGRAADSRAVLAAVEAMFPEGLAEALRLECALPASEVRLMEDDAQGALATVLGALDLPWPHVGLRLGLAVVGLRAAADIAQDGRARRDEEAVRRATPAAERCLAEVSAQRLILAGWDPPTPSKLATADLAEAEMARLNGQGEPDRWASIAGAFDLVPMPYPAAYARYRQAEALLVRGGVKAAAGDLLRAANETCRVLGATPLAAAIARLARQARVDLALVSAPVLQPESPPEPAVARTSGGRRTVGTGRNDLALSTRELQVLSLVAAGRTNGQIALELFISPKTASVHVTHILDKLGASNRVEAAMIAARAGLLD